VEGRTTVTMNEYGFFWNMDEIDPNFRIVHPRVLDRSRRMYHVMDVVYLVRNIEDDYSEEVLMYVVQDTYARLPYYVKDDWEIMDELLLVELVDPNVQKSETFLITQDEWETNSEKYEIIDSVVLFTTHDEPNRVRTMSLIEYVGLRIPEQYLDVISVHHVCTLTRREAIRNDRLQILRKRQRDWRVHGVANRYVSGGILCQQNRGNCRRE